MFRTRWLPAAAVAAGGGLLAALASLAPAQDEPKAAAPGPQPPTKITAAQATLAPDFSGQLDQTNMDLYAWLTFLAMNWPADPATCGADPNVSILTGKGPVVWETYLQDSDIFRPKGAPPKPWCPKTPTNLPADLPAGVAKMAAEQGAAKVLDQTSKAHVKLLERFPEAGQVVGSVLVDQNGRFARYEVRVNEDEYNYIVQNELYSAAGQKKFAGPVKMPAGKTNFGPVGAMEIKASWKVLGPNDDPKKFYSIKAVVYNDPYKKPDDPDTPSLATLGLVGLHITHKTPTQPQWIWATFEHVDNCPTQGTPPAQKAYSFYNPASPAPVNQFIPQAQVKPERDKNGKPQNPPSQIVRVAPIEQQAVAMNQTFQKLLAGSVWANYQLVSAQWSGNFGPAPKPPFLANTTIETYNQGPTPPTDGPTPYNPFTPKVSSSCRKCHNLATTTNNKNADFSFLLGNAE